MSCDPPSAARAATMSIRYELSPDGPPDAALSAESEDRAGEPGRVGVTTDWPDPPGATAIVGDEAVGAPSVTAVTDEAPPGAPKESEGEMDDIAVVSGLAESRPEPLPPGAKPPGGAPAESVAKRWTRPRVNWVVTSPCDGRFFVSVICSPPESRPWIVLELSGVPVVVLPSV